MTVEELIEELRKLPEDQQNAQVIANFSPGGPADDEVSGVLYHPERHEVEIV